MATATGPAIRAYTLLSRSSTPILKFLTDLQRPAHDAVAFFNLSLNADNLGSLVTALQGLSPKHAGCLSAPLPSATSHTVCSVALFPRSQCSTVRTTMPGRKQAQVGRWHVKGRDEPRPLGDAPPEMPAEGKWAQAWEQHNPNRVQTKFELGALDDSNAFLFFSDSAPEGLIEALDYQVPRKVAKLGMVSASTPFVTGRPFTLFHDARIYSSGAVGVALKSSVSPQNDVSFRGYTAISDALRITDVRGNLVHKINDSNPTRILLDHIEARAASSPELAKYAFLTKEDEFFIGIPFSVETGDNETGYQRIYRITSGDPKKGTMSLDADDGPPAGTRVQFLRRSGVWQQSLATNQEGDVMFDFQTTSDELPVDPMDMSLGSGEEDMRVTEKLFSMASEHELISNALAGMPLGRGRCWRTSVLGSQGALSLP
ncbi:hypothetical protein CALCODRAFT_497402 [Calocera cornea HHB12733]|uniref:FIST domain-containing protein n=1 Tax=Calocera cornea HHB12733 TaxID=1353952 RepID=A0A165F8A6_9BASI|nr:hypothetical protein CALCODRAFT_497402 [Calocera cornea HHB12733]